MRNVENSCFCFVYANKCFDVFLYFPEKIGEAVVNDQMQPQQISLPRCMDREAKLQLSIYLEHSMQSLNYLQHMLL